MPVNGKVVYELDSGWGFDGETFEHFFETSHVFAENSANYIGINAVRMYGRSHGVAGLSMTASGVEDDFDQSYGNVKQDLSLPFNPPTQWYSTMKDVTNFVDLGSWGLGIKLKLQNNQEKGLTSVEPSHICQVLVLHVRTNGTEDA